MKHKIGFNRLGRKESHRRALHRNMATSLFRYERIKTTKAKALAIRRTAEKMITRAKNDSVHSRRIIAKDIKDKEIVAKLFTDIGPRFKERPGGYTRILKLGYRQGDAAEMVLLELVEQNEPEKKKKSTKSSKAKKAETVQKKKAADVKKEVVPEETEAAEAPVEEIPSEETKDQVPEQKVEAEITASSEETAVEETSKEKPAPEKKPVDEENSEVQKDGEEKPE